MTAHPRGPKRRARRALWPRRRGIVGILVGLLVLAAPVSAAISASDTLEAVSVAYCQPPTSILVSSLKFLYNRKTEILSFSVEMSSIRSDARLDIDFSLYVYGRLFVDMSIDLCTIANGALCPVPEYHFAAESQVSVPKEFSSGIPKIAFTVPDIEAFAMIRMKDQSTGADTGCVQLSLSNSLTTDLVEIAWAVGGFVIGTSVLAVLATAADAPGSLPWRIVDLMRTVYMVPLASMITTITPRVVHKFSLRFGWALGLISVPSVQHSITDTRRKTGSDDLDLTFGSLKDAEFSRLANYYPAAVLNTNQSAQIATPAWIDGLLLAEPLSLTPLPPPPPPPPRQRRHGAGHVPRAHLQRRANYTVTQKQYAPNTGPGGEMAPSSPENNVVWAVNIDAFSQAGAFYYIESLNLSPYSAYLTAMVSWLWVFLVVLFISAIATVLVGIVRRRRWWVGKRAQRTARIFVRFLEVVSTPILLLALFQWVHSNAWPSHLGAALGALAVALGWLYVLVRVVLVRWRDGVPALYSRRAPPSAALAHPWRPKTWYFGAVMAVADFVRVCFVAIPQKHNFGMRQGVGLLVLETIVLVLLLVLRPGRDRFNTAVHVVLAFARAAVWAMAVCLTTQVNYWGISRAIMGFVQLVTLALPIVFVFFVLLWDVFYTCAMWPPNSKQRSSRYDDMELEPKDAAHGFQRVASSDEVERDADTSLMPLTGVGAQRDSLDGTDTTADVVPPGDVAPGKPVYILPRPT